MNDFTKLAMQSMSLSILVVLISVAQTGTSSDVLTLTDENFEKKLNDLPIVLVKFYAPWCGHCKKLAPEFESAATVLKSNDPQVALAEVDCTSNGKQTCKKFDVNGYPTLKAFKYGRVAFEFDGTKDSDSIVKYMQFKVNPGSQELKSLDELADYINSTDNVVIGFFDRKGSTIEKEFHKLADTQKEHYKFAHTYSNKIMTTFGFRDDIALFRSEKLQTKLEQSRVKFEGELTLYQLRNWLTTIYYGLVGFRTSRNLDHFKTPFVVVYYDIDFVSQSTITHYWRNRVMMVARKYTSGKRKVTFAVSDANEFRRELSDFGLNASDAKPLVAARDVAQRRYVYTNEFSIEGLEQFVDDLLDGLLLPYIKSEQVPLVDDDIVKLVVGKTFDQIVNDHAKDVLLVLHAPYSSQCKTVIETLEKVAKKLQDDRDIVFAKMDATANEVPRPYAIKGYPSIYFVPKSSKLKPKLYEGSQGVGDFISFLAQESTLPLKKYDRKGKKIKTEKMEKNGNEKIEL